MHVTSFYYLAYPDSSPADPTCAATEMYVEVGAAGDTIDHFKDTYAFRVYTFNYVQIEFINRGKPLMGRAVMIVPTLDDDWMLQFLNENVEELVKYGEPR